MSDRNAGLLICGSDFLEEFMLKGKKILIAGAGISGVGAARLLGEAGFDAAVV